MKFLADENIEELVIQRARVRQTARPRGHVDLPSSAAFQKDVMDSLYECKGGDVK